MKENKNTILVTIQNLNKDHYDPPLELQRTLRSVGTLAEIVTPYSDLPKGYRWKISMWKFFTSLSKKKGFSIVLPIIFLLKGFEIYRQIKLHWSDFDRILVYDRISGFAAKKATNDQIPIILLQHYGGDPYMAYIYEYGVEKRRLGYILMQKILIAIFNQPIHKLLSTS
jgi:hypothetical protein